MKRRSYERFASLVAAFDWRGIYSRGDINVAFLYFHKPLKLIYDQAFPERIVKKTYHTRKTWLTECLKVSKIILLKLDSNR